MQSMGYACGGDASAWCLKYGLNRQASYSLMKFGEQAASALASFWCQRMQSFYDAFLESGEESYRYTDSDLASAPHADSCITKMGELPKAHPAWGRMHEIARIAPRLAGSAASSSSGVV